MTEQGVTETVDQYVCRLREKASTCEFSNVDELIRDQLIDKCCDARLHRKFLKKTGNAATLKSLQEAARAFEAVNQQMKQMHIRLTLSEKMRMASQMSMPSGENRNFCATEVRN